MKKKPIDQYAEAIKNITKVDDSLPRFLLDPCFEYNNAILRSSYHSFESLRWAILRKIESLEFILKKDDKRLQEKCDSATPKQISKDIY